MSPALIDREVNIIGVFFRLVVTGKLKEVSTDKNTLFHTITMIQPEASRPKWISGVLPQSVLHYTLTYVKFFANTQRI